MRETLSAIVGPKWVKSRQAELAPYDADGLPGYRAMPALAVFPGTRDELIAVVRALAVTGTAWVPRGAGTGLSGGALANDVVLIGLNRLTRIIDVDPVNRLARVEPGVVNARLSRETTRYGLQYAPDPSSQTVCTIGGNVAETPAARIASSTASPSITSWSAKWCSLMGVSRGSVARTAKAKATTCWARLWGAKGASALRPK